MQSPLLALTRVDAWKHAMELYFLDAMAMLWRGLWWYLAVCLLIGAGAIVWSIWRGDDDGPRGL